MPEKKLPALLLRALTLWIRGRVHFCRDLESVGLEDRGEEFRAFRKVTVDPSADGSLDHVIRA